MSWTAPRRCGECQRMVDNCQCCFAPASCLAPDEGKPEISLSDYIGTDRARLYHLVYESLVLSGQYAEAHKFKRESIGIDTFNGMLQLGEQYCEVIR